jgi:hypothetical protein
MEQKAVDDEKRAHEEARQKAIAEKKRMEEAEKKKVEDAAQAVLDEQRRLELQQELIREDEESRKHGNKGATKKNK